MSTAISSVKTLWNRRTPRYLVALIVTLLLTDFVTLFVLVKLHTFPFSKDWPHYWEWVENQLSMWTGRFFWIAVFMACILALIRGVKFKMPQLSGLIELALNKARQYLNRSAVAVYVLLVTVLALPLFFVLLPPVVLAPAPAGKFVIPTDPNSSVFYRVINYDKQHLVAAYKRARYNSSIAYPPSTNFEPSDAGILENVALARDAKRIFVTDSAKDKVWIFNASTSGSEVASLDVKGNVGPMALSADGEKLYVGVIGPIPQGRIDVFDGINRRDVSSISTRSDPIRGVGCPIELFAASRAPRLFVVTQCGGGQDPLYVIDTRTDQVIKKLPGFAVGLHVAATSDGRTVFVVASDRFAIVNNYMGELPQIEWHTGQVTAMAVSPDDRTLFVGVHIDTTLNEEKETNLDADPYGRICLSTGHPASQLPRGALLSLNTRTGEPCKAQPVWLESEPTAIAIAPDGNLYVPLPCRLFVSDSRALACN
jgi:WD40 repeat protein/succinate dehydrogenase/fumarate reductase cytochrome b subunit